MTPRKPLPRKTQGRWWIVTVERTNPLMDPVDVTPFPTEQAALRYAQLGITSLGSVVRVTDPKGVELLRLTIKKRLRAKHPVCQCPVLRDDRTKLVKAFTYSRKGGTWVHDGCGRPTKHLDSEGGRR